MRCEEVKERWANRLVGTLDAEGEQAVREHVSACPSCRAELPDLETLWQAMGTVPPLEVASEASDRMRQRFAVTLAQEQAGGFEGSAESRAADSGASVAPLPFTSAVHQAGRQAAARHWSQMPLVQLALAASLLLVGVLVGRGVGPTTGSEPAVPSAEIADVRSELRDLRQMLTLSLLQQQSAVERLRGVSWTEQLDQPGNEIVAALLDTLLHDPNDNVRLAAVDALRRFSDRDDVRRATLRAAGDSSSPMLQIAAIDFIADLREPSAEPLLRRLSQDPAVDESVRGRAATALARLAS